MLLIGLTVHVHGEGSRTWDKLWSLPAIGVPIIVHSPETDWGFGAGVQGYFKMPDSERTSIVYGDGCYTLNKQYYFSAGGTFYFGGNTPWFLRFRGGYRNYPDTYYGLGNEYGYDQQHPLPYTSQRRHAYIEAQFELPANWSLGPLFNFRHEKYLLSTIDYQQSTIWGLGAVTQYDTRNLHLAPLPDLRTCLQTCGSLFSCPKTSFSRGSSVPNGHSRTISPIYRLCTCLPSADKTCCGVCGKICSAIMS